MDDAEWRAFVSEGTRTAKLATTRHDGRPHVVPIWFVLDGEDFVFTTGEHSIKGRALARTGLAALCVDDPRPPYAFVSVTGTVGISRNADELLRWATTIGGRYMGADRAEEFRTPSASHYKTSLIVLVDHKPGMLALTLQAFGVRGVNLMALQSRPERSAPWTYRFYVDVEGSAHDPRVAEALEEIEALAAKLIVLGSYEAWTEGSRLSAPVPPPAHRVEKPAVPLVDRRRNPEGTVVQVQGGLRRR